MADKYKIKDLEGQLLNDMKRRAAFIAKCRREKAKIDTSARLIARITSQFAKLSTAIGRGAEKTPEEWTQGFATNVAIIPAEVALAIENTSYTDAQFREAHIKASTAFQGYAAKLNWTVPV